MNSETNFSVTSLLKPVWTKVFWSICISSSMICSDIWQKYHEWYFEIVIRNFTRLVKFETILKYHKWYLCQISRTNHAIISLRSKRFQSSYCAKGRAEAKKRLKGGRGGEKRKRLPANHTILENSPWYFTVRFICKLTARQNRNITNRLPLDYQICKITLFSNRTRCRQLQEL